ncbi:flagellin lysine-N-methylase [Thalassotalea ganghwensis]
MSNKQLFGVMTPEFFSEFSCVGADCVDNCCRSWEINIDKKTFKNLRKSENIIVRQMANEHLEYTRESEHSWGKIKLKDNGFCPFLDQKGWCEIHKQLGHEALSKTCQNYPKSMLMFGNQIEPTLSISCPSAAEAVLFNPSAFMFKRTERMLQDLNHNTLGGYTEDTLPAWMPILRDFCFSVILFEEIPVEHRLFAIGMTLKQGEQHIDDVNRLVEFLGTAEEMTADGSFSKMYDDLPVKDPFKWVMFANQSYKLDEEAKLYAQVQVAPKNSENQTRFDQVRTPMFELIEQRKADHPDVKEVDLFLDIFKAGNEKVETYLADKPHTIINYLIYYFFHNQFMFNHNKTPFQFFKILSVDLFMQRCYLAALAEKHGEMNDQWFIQMFQTYARRRQHDNYFVENMEIQLKNSNTDGAGDIFSLLK